MPHDVRLWEIRDGDRLREIKHSKLNMEARIENWLEQDISIISADMLVIGRQIETDFGGVIDLLCLDHNGDLVVVELKREKTPREVTAQVLDYASWVKDLSHERVTELADRYFGDEGALEDAFRGRFGWELPEILNEHHKMLIVASQIDTSSERIINYLSDTYGVTINAVTFQYFRDDNGKEYLGRAFLIEPSEVEYKAQTRGSLKRKPNLTYEELQAIAEGGGVGELYKRLVNGLTAFFDSRTATRSTVSYSGNMEGSRLAIFSLVPGRSDSGRGVNFYFYVGRFLDYFGVERGDIDAILPAQHTVGESYKDGPATVFGFFKDDEANTFLAGLKRFKQGDREDPVV